jgi:predicted glycogen debranching enzyme
MISLPALILVTGKFAQARAMLELYAAHLQRGLIPSEFPEDGSPPLYLSADASLWFINAAYAYWKQSTDDSNVQRALLEPILQIIRSYRAGTSLGISCDPDGLVGSRALGFGTSWMNAKVDDWVITPRAGRPVELNALWYNALRIAAELCERFGQPAESSDLHRFADSVKTAFNQRFWNADLRCCFDVVGDHSPDPAIRPNQIFAISLPFAVLAAERYIAVLEKLRNELLTPFGLRTLAPDDPSYRGRYGGDVISRDRAYHNGSAYPWLLGAFVTALVRTHGNGHSTRRQAQEILAGPIQYLQSNGLGQLCELFDGDKPHKPGGLIASARSVAEILRCYLEDVMEPSINPLTPVAARPDPAAQRPA